MTQARGEDGVHRGTFAAVVSAVVVHSERYGDHFFTSHVSHLPRCETTPALYSMPLPSYWRRRLLCFYYLQLTEGAFH